MILINGNGRFIYIFCTSNFSCWISVLRHSKREGKSEKDLAKKAVGLDSTPKPKSALRAAIRTPTTVDAEITTRAPSHECMAWLRIQVALVDSYRLINKRTESRRGWGLRTKPGRERVGRVGPSQSKTDGRAYCASYQISISKLVSAPVDSYRYHLISERDVT